MSAGAHKGKRGWHRLSQKKHELDALRNEINVTPLVDVCLVLLIIFMVVTPLMARGKEVKMPLTANHSTEKDKLQPVVAIDNEGRFFFNKERVETLDQLKERVEATWKEHPEVTSKVFVKADRDLPYSKVYPLIVAMHELDVQGIDLGTNEIKKK
jgi:biopolymer transport protein TolR